MIDMTPDELEKHLRDEAAGKEHRHSWMLGAYMERYKTLYAEYARVKNALDAEYRRMRGAFDEPSSRRPECEQE